MTKGLRKLFVGGLPSQATREDLLNYFSRYGEISNAYIIFDPKTKVSRRKHWVADLSDFGYVEFKQVEAAMSAVEQPTHEICHKRVTVEHHHKNTMGSPQGPIQASEKEFYEPMAFASFSTPLQIEALEKGSSIQVRNPQASILESGPQEWMKKSTPGWLGQGSYNPLFGLGGPEPGLSLQQATPNWRFEQKPDLSKRHSANSAEAYCPTWKTAHGAKPLKEEVCRRPAEHEAGETAFPGLIPLNMLGCASKGPQLASMQEDFEEAQEKNGRFGGLETRPMSAQRGSELAFGHQAYEVGRSPSEFCSGVDDPRETELVASPKKRLHKIFYRHLKRLGGLMRQKVINQAEADQNLRYNKETKPPLHLEHYQISKPVSSPNPLDGTPSLLYNFELLKNW